MDNYHRGSVTARAADLGSFASVTSRTVRGTEDGKRAESDSHSWRHVTEESCDVASGAA